MRNTTIHPLQRCQRREPEENIWIWVWDKCWLQYSKRVSKCQEMFSMDHFGGCIALPVYGQRTGGGNCEGSHRDLPYSRRSGPRLCCNRSDSDPRPGGWRHRVLERYDRLLPCSVAAIAVDQRHSSPWLSVSRTASRRGGSPQSTRYSVPSEDDLHATTAGAGITVRAGCRRQGLTCRFGYGASSVLKRTDCHQSLCRYTVSRLPACPAQFWLLHSVSSQAATPALSTYDCVKDQFPPMPPAQGRRAGLQRRHPRGQSASCLILTAATLRGGMYPSAPCLHRGHKRM